MRRIKLRFVNPRAARRFRGAHARRMRIAMARVAAVDQQATADLNWRKGSERSCEVVGKPASLTRAFLHCSRASRIGGAWYDPGQILAEDRGAPHRLDV